MKTEHLIEGEHGSAAGQGDARAVAAEPRVAVVMKGYPRLSETFIAQELLALQRRGLGFALWALRRPTDAKRHKMHEEIGASASYLPAYLYQEPWRVLKGLIYALRQPTARAFLAVAVADLKREFNAHRLRRFGQACVLARELPAGIKHLHVHFLHTPASVVRYTSILRGLSWSFSAHARDIWTIPDWEKREKIEAAAWGVTCTCDGHRELARLAQQPQDVTLVYHGLDLSRFPPPPDERKSRAGSEASDPVRLITIGRAVPKKGFDDLLVALARLPASLYWRLAHIGGGELLPTLRKQADALGLAERVEWRGPQAQGEVIEALRQADLFVLPSKLAADGDRDGLPNVIMEAASQALPIIATNFAGIPEFVRDGVDGLLVPPGDVTALADGIAKLSAAPGERARLGAAAFRRLKESFSAEAGCDFVHRRLEVSLAAAEDAA